MALTPEQVGRLLKKIQQTQEVELSCPECLDELDRYTQKVLDRMQIEGLLDRVREHLEACSCCNSQFQLVLETLDAIEGS